MAAPFVRAIGAALAGMGQAEEEPKHGEFRHQARQNQGKTPCLLRGLCVTHGGEPEGSSFLWKWHQKALWIPSASELSPCPSSSVLAAKEAAPMVCPKDPSLCGVPQVQRLSGANDTEGLNKARTHLQKQQSKENAKRKTNKNSHKKRRMKQWAPVKHISCFQASIANSHRTNAPPSLFSRNKSFRAELTR